MSNVKASLVTILALLSIASATIINKECQVEKNNVSCECVGNKEFYLPDEYNYRNTTSLRLSSCANAKLLFPCLSESTNLTELVIGNISKLLTLELLLSTQNFSRLELTNVKKIPAIKSDLFITFKKIEHLVLRNVFIESFEEHFTKMSVVNVVMENVTINRVEGLNFMEGGKKLVIINCEFRKITKSLNFHFTNVTIINSRFEMQKREYFRVNGETAFFQNIVFYNVSMDVNTKTNITVINTCGGGQSNLRLSSFNVTTFDNKWPTDINYSPNGNNELKIPEKNNNLVCIAGNCQCPKGNGQNGTETITVTFLLQIFLIWLTYTM